MVVVPSLLRYPRRFLFSRLCAIIASSSALVRCIGSTPVLSPSSSATYVPIATSDSEEAEAGEQWAECSGCVVAGPPENGQRRMSSSVPFEPLKWAFLLIYLVLAGLSNWAVLAYTHDYVPREALPDVVFFLMPEQEWASRVGDWMVTTCLASLILLLFFHEARQIILRRVLFIVATLYSMRSCTLMVTQLPAGYENNEMRCRERLNSSVALFFSRLGEQTIRLGFQEKLGMLCGDLMFSGHTLVMVTCALTIVYYLPSKWRLLHWITTISAIFGVLCLVISRTHYSIDVLVAYWLTNFTFRIYHAYCELDICLERSRSVLHGIWAMRVVEWLEDTIAPGRIENKFSIPFFSSLSSSCVDGSKGHHKQISIRPLQSSSTTFNMP